ncbi:hypothetical protein FRC08_011498 [Ceratobasidium sp. 394]|nr:hypothetical protein FRC08_011498 [Ceratobasidium sp. 394]
MSTKCGSSLGHLSCPSHIRAHSYKAGYLTTAWDEKTVSAEDAAIKITRVRSERKFTGAMEGTAVAEYIICYHPDSKSPEGPHAGKLLCNAYILRFEVLN